MNADHFTARVEQVTQKARSGSRLADDEIHVRSPDQGTAWRGSVRGFGGSLLAGAGASSDKEALYQARTWVDDHVLVPRETGRYPELRAVVGRHLDRLEVHEVPGGEQGDLRAAAGEDERGCRDVERPQVTSERELHLDI